MYQKKTSSECHAFEKDSVIACSAHLSSDVQQEFNHCFDLTWKRVKIGKKKRSQKLVERDKKESKKQVMSDYDWAQGRI